MCLSALLISAGVSLLMEYFKPATYQGMSTGSLVIVCAVLLVCCIALLVALRFPNRVYRVDPGQILAVYDHEIKGLPPMHDIIYPPEGTHLLEEDDCISMEVEPGRGHRISRVRHPVDLPGFNTVYVDYDLSWIKLPPKSYEKVLEMNPKERDTALGQLLQMAPDYLKIHLNTAIKQATAIVLDQPELRDKFQDYVELAFRNHLEAQMKCGSRVKILAETFESAVQKVHLHPSR
jgi:hypothetical protein